MTYKTQHTIWNISVAIGLTLMVCGIIWLISHHLALVEQLKADCRAAGGRVEVVHGNNQGAWICLGEDNGHDI